jgi:hypothetical protein
LFWDHAGGLDLFPGARVYVHDAAYAFWMEDPVASRPAFGFFWDEALREKLDAVAAEGRLELKSKVSSPDLLFPGRDPLMTRNYPQAAGNLALQAARRTRRGPGAGACPSGRSRL